MHKLLCLILFALAASAQTSPTMILTPTYIATLKARVNGVNPVPAEWTILRTRTDNGSAGCDFNIQYTAGTPDHLPPVYASMEHYTDAQGNGGNGYIAIGSDANRYEGGDVMMGLSLSLCYLVLKDGDVTPYGWNSGNGYTWNGIALTPQQYGLLAGIQAFKILNKATPTAAKSTPASSPINWGGLAWQTIQGAPPARMFRNNGSAGSQVYGTIDALTANAVTNATTAAGNNTLHFTNAKAMACDLVFTVGDQVSGTNITAGTTVSSIGTGGADAPCGGLLVTSVVLSANVTGSGVASGAVIADIPSNSCTSPGQAPVFVGGNPGSGTSHTAITLSNIMGPLGTQLNGNTYYVSTLVTTTGGWNSSNYGYYLDTTSGGGTSVCTVPNQGASYKGAVVGSGQNYNHDQDQDYEFPPRYFLPGMSLLYDWLHPLINQSVATGLNGLASTISATSGGASITGTFTASGSAWNASTNPWTDSTATANGNYPQAILVGYSTLQAQALDAMDSWIRGLFLNYYNGNDLQTFVVASSNYHWGHYAGLGLAGIAAYNDDSRGHVWYDYWRNHMHLAIDQPFAARWFGANGNMMDAWNYQSFAISNIALAQISNITAMGDDLVSNSAQPYSWIVGLEYYKHNLEPNGNSELTRGYVEYPGWSTSPLYVNQAYASALFPVQYLADLENHTLKNKFRSYVQSFITKWGESVGLGDAYTPFLFWDPSATQTSWSNEPTVLGNLANPAGGYGHVYMRSDWTTGAIFADLAARPLIYDQGNGKDRYDSVGTMLLQRGSNTMLVNPLAECVREAPITQVGIGVTLFNNATACWNYVSSLYLGGGYYQPMQTAGNPSTTTTVGSVTLTTNASTGSGAVLHFASTAGATTGMIAIGTNIPSFAYVLSIGSTSVTLNQSVTGTGVGNGDTIILATIDSYGGRYGEAQGGTAVNNYFFMQPGWLAARAPVCTGAGSPYAPAASYSVTTGHSTDAFTVTLASPTTDGWGTGTPILLTWSSGATAPTYYVSDGSGTTASFGAGTLYQITNWSGSGGTRTFGLAIAPTNFGTWAGYPTTGLTAVTIAAAGSGTQYIQGGTCNSGIGTMEAETHPTRIDLLESTASYAYARAVNMEALYNNNPYLTGYKGHVLANQREVLYLLPKLFLVYDRTRNAHWNQQAVNFTSIVDSDGANPAYLVTAGHIFHSGMKVVISGGTCASGGKSVNGQTYTLTVLDGYRLALNEITSPLGYTCTGTATGNIWGHQVIPWHTGAVPTEVTTGGQITAGMRQWYVEAPAVNIATIGNTTPVKLTTSTPHMLNTGFTINVAGITGVCAGLNGNWAVTIPSTSNSTDLYTMTLNGSTACGAGTVGSSTIQKFNGAITSIKPLTPPVVLTDLSFDQGSPQTAGGFVYRLEIHDPRNCTSNSTWCQVSGADGADSQNWLTALDASQSAADTATITPLTASNADMVQVSSTAVAGFQNSQVASGACNSGTGLCSIPAPALPITYMFTQPGGAASHVIAGMTPSITYYVTAAGGSVTIAATGSSGAMTATASGILAFSSSGGGAAPRSAIIGPVKIAGPVKIQ
jgi:hypothetical protein